MQVIGVRRDGAHLCTLGDGLACVWLGGEVSRAMSLEHVMDQLGPWAAVPKDLEVRRAAEKGLSRARLSLRLGYRMDLVEGKEHTDKFKRCVEKVMAQGHEESSAFAICTSSFQEAGNQIWEASSINLYGTSEGAKLGWESRERADEKPTGEKAGRAKEIPAKEYHAQFEAAFKDNPYSAFVSHYTEDEMKKMTPLATNDGKTGVLIKDHGDGRIEATALYNKSDVKGAGIKLLKESIEHHGVNYVEAYGGFLPDLYGKLGFETTEKYPFDPAQAAPGWNYEKFDHPDYHIMRLKEATMAKKDLADDQPASADPDIDLDKLRREVEDKMDPEWRAKYGDEAWKAALAVIGEPTD